MHLHTNKRDIILKKDIRRIKVHTEYGYKDKINPTILLKGDYLKRFGFEIAPIIVTITDKQLTIKKVSLTSVVVISPTYVLFSCPLTSLS